MKNGMAEGADEPHMVNGLEGMTARCVTHPGHTHDIIIDWWPVTSERIGTLPSIFP